MGGDILSVLLAINGDASGAINAISQTEGQMNNLSGSTSKTGAGLAVMGGAMTAIGGVSANFLSDAVGTSADFDQEIRTFAAVSGPEAANQIGAIHDKALELGKDTTFSAQEAAGAMTELSKAGIPVQDVLEGAGRAALDLAAASGEDVPRAVEVLSDSYNSFGDDVQRLKDLGEDAPKHFADKITQAANASTISVNDFGYSISASGSVANLMGIHFDDLATSIAIMGANGIKGSDAGTSLKTMMMNLVPMTDKAYDTMQAFGLAGMNTTKSLQDMEAAGNKVTQSGDKWIVNGKEFGSQMEAVNQTLYNMAGFEGDISDASSKAQKDFQKWQIQNGYLASSFFDVNGNAKSMSEIAGELHDKLGNLAPDVQVKALHDMFGTDAIRAASTFTRLGSDGFDEMGQKIDAAGTASATADARMAGMKGSTEQLSGSMETAKIIIGEFASKALQPVVEFVTNLINMFISAPPEVQGFITAIMGIVGGLGLIGGPIVLIAGMWPMITAGIGSVMAALSPVILPILAIVGAIIGLKLAWDNNFLGIRDTVTAFWNNTLQPFLSQAFTWFQQNIPSALQFLQNAFTQAWQWIQQNVMPVLETIFTEIGKFWTEIQPKLEQVWNFIRDNIIVPVMNFIGTYIINTLSGLAANWDGIWNGISTTLGGIWDTIKGIVEIAWNLVTGIIKIGLDLLTGDWEGAWNHLKEMLSGIWQGIQDVLHGAWEIVSGIFQTGWNTVSGLWTGLWDSVKGFLTDTWNNITGFLNTAKDNVFNTVLGIGGSIIDGIKQGIQNAWDGLTGFIHDMAMQLPEPIRNALNIHSPSRTLADEVGQHIPGGIKEGAEAGWGSLTDSLKQKSAEIVPAIKEGLSLVPTAFDAIFGPLDKGGAIELLLFGKPDGFFNRVDEKQRVALDFNRHEVWESSLNLLQQKISEMLGKIQASAGQAAYNVGATISAQIAAGIRSGISDIEAAVTTAGAAATPAGGTSTVINNTTNVRQQFVDNTSTQNQYENQRTQARNRG